VRALVYVVVWNLGMHGAAPQSCGAKHAYGARLVVWGPELTALKWDIIVTDKV